MKSKYEISATVKVHHQVSVEAESLEKAIADVKEQLSKQYPYTTYNDIVITEIQEDFI